MKARRSPEAPLFEFLDVPADEIERHPTVVDDIHHRRLDGVIVRGVYPAADVAEVVRRLEDGPPLQRGDPEALVGHTSRPYTYGRAIMGDTDLDAYHAHAAAFRVGCRELFSHTFDLEARVERVLGVLAAGRRVALPTSEDGRPYTPATVRVLGDGHGIGVHVGNSFIRMPQARRLLELTNHVDQLSWFIPLRVPDEGGRLVVYALEWDDARDLDLGAGYQAADDEVGLVDLLFDRTAFAPGVGDLLLFDGGRYFHRVSTVRGPRSRLTIGGFCGLSTDDATLYYWS